MNCIIFLSRKNNFSCLFLYIRIKRHFPLVCPTKACISLTKSITSFEAGYSSKTTVQQLAVVIWVVLVIFVHFRKLRKVNILWLYKEVKHTCIVSFYRIFELLKTSVHDLAILFILSVCSLSEKFSLTWSFVK